MPTTWRPQHPPRLSRYVPSFGTFEHAYHLAGSQAFMPPQGLLTIAVYLSAHWNVRFLDENMGAASAEDFAWADVVFASGMHIQRRELDGICARAHEAGKIAVLGGPSVSQPEGGVRAGSTLQSHRHQLAHVWPKRSRKLPSRQRLRLLPEGLPIPDRLLWHVGILVEGDYRGTFGASPCRFWPRARSSRCCTTD